MTLGSDQVFGRKFLETVRVAKQVSLEILFRKRLAERYTLLKGRGVELLMSWISAQLSLKLAQQLWDLTSKDVEEVVLHRWTH